MASSILLVCFPVWVWNGEVQTYTLNVAYPAGSTTASAEYIGDGVFLTAEPGPSSTILPTWRSSLGQVMAPAFGVTLRPPA